MVLPSRARYVIGRLRTAGGSGNREVTAYRGVKRARRVIASGREDGLGLWANRGLG